MSVFIKNILFVVLLSQLSLLVACSDKDDKNVQQKVSADHVWKEQTDVLKSAQDAAKKMQETLNQNKQKLNESN